MSRVEHVEENLGQDFRIKQDYRFILINPEILSTVYERRALQIVF